MSCLMALSILILVGVVQPALDTTLRATAGPGSRLALAMAPHHDDDDSGGKHGDYDAG